MNPASIVTIKNKKPLFKGEESATSIELIELEEVGFDLVSQKDLYQIGDKAVYIQPDYCVSDIPLFESFIRPKGDESKSMLGKVNGLPRRIRAKKFNLSITPNGEPVYSNGILLPINEVMNYKLFDTDSNLTLLLGITKYEEPEYVSKTGMKVEGSLRFPEGIYKTDESNIHNQWKNIQFPITLVGTEKIDGSSCTIGITPEIPEGFICSRNMRKKLKINKAVGRRSMKWYEYLMFWKKPDLNIYEEVDSEDDFVKYGLPYLNILKAIDFTNIILRGELNGGHLKGSGNPNNPASKERANIKFFGVDQISENKVAVKVPYHNFISFTNDLNFPVVKTVFQKEFTSREDLLDTCKEYFKSNNIEGIVVRTLDSQFSAKVMNDVYDSKK